MKIILTKKNSMELNKDFAVDKEYPVVESVIKNSPADKAGLAKGDKLWDIDGVDLFDKNSAYVVNLIKILNHLTLCFTILINQKALANVFL